MTQDLLKQATKALGESGHEQRGARFTRERLMASLHERQRRRRSRFALVLPLAAIFVGSTAFAAVTGKLDVLVLSALDVVGYSEPATSPVTSPPSPARPAPKRAAARHAPAAEVQPAEQQTEETAGAPDSAADVPKPVESDPVPPSRSEAPQAPRAPSVAGAGEERDGHSVYRQAHQAQFQRSDCSEAVRGYEQYLRENSGGRFALDARYNRALCLVRLGRSEEAQRVLTRFAEGAYGGYRQADARRLLGALGRSSSAEQ